MACAADQPPGSALLPVVELARGGVVPAQGHGRAARGTFGAVARAAKLQGERGLRVGEHGGLEGRSVWLHRRRYRRPILGRGGGGSKVQQGYGLETPRPVSAAKQQAAATGSSNQHEPHRSSEGHSILVYATTLVFLSECAKRSTAFCSVRLCASVPWFFVSVLRCDPGNNVLENRLSSRGVGGQINSSAHSIHHLRWNLNVPIGLARSKTVILQTVVCAPAHCTVCPPADRNPNKKAFDRQYAGRRINGMGAKTKTKPRQYMTFQTSHLWSAPGWEPGTARVSAAVHLDRRRGQFRRHRYQHEGGASRAIKYTTVSIAPKAHEERCRHMPCLQLRHMYVAGRTSHQGSLNTPRAPTLDRRPFKQHSTHTFYAAGV